MTFLAKNALEGLLFGLRAILLALKNFQTLSVSHSYDLKVAVEGREIYYMEKYGGKYKVKTYM